PAGAAAVRGPGGPADTVPRDPDQLDERGFGVRPGRHRGRVDRGRTRRDLAGPHYVLAEAGGSDRLRRGRPDPGPLAAGRSGDAPARALAVVGEPAAA